MNIKYLSLTIMSFLLLAPALVSAQGLKDANKALEAIAKPAGVQNKKDIKTVIGVGINVALSLVGLIFLILMVYAGYLWMTARGESEPVESAKKIITASIIGIVIVVSAYAITFLVTTRLQGL